MTVNSKICKYFLNFVPTVNVNRKDLSNIILNFFECSEINYAYSFGQGYDEASTMSGEFH